LSSEHVLDKVSNQINRIIPANAGVTAIEFEGPEVAIYSKNISVLIDSEGLLSQIARTIRKRVVIRSDPAVRLPIDKVLEKLKKILHDKVIIGDIEFDKNMGEVIIYVDKPNKLTRKQDDMINTITKETLWRPKFFRIPPIKSNVIKSVRNVLFSDSAARKEALRKYNQNKARRHYHKNKERRKESSRLWKKRNPEYAANYSRQYLKDNRDKINEFAKKYIKIRRKIDVNFRFALQIRGRIRQALKTQRSYKTNTTFKLIGCNLAELKNHLEALFTEGMAWDNYGYSGWQIDHIIPCASFDLTDPEQQKVCFHFSNLQPLWAEDNLKKGAKVG